MTVAILAVTAGAEHGEGEQLASTMGLTTFALANLFFSAGLLVRSGAAWSSIVFFEAWKLGLRRRPAAGVA